MVDFLHYKGRQYIKRAQPDCYQSAFEIFRTAGSGTLLDLAAGGGYTSAVLRDMGFQVTATEINTDQFAADDVKLVTADLNRGIPFDDRSFDNVLALEILEHLESPKHFLREIGRVLRPGGTAVITTPNIASWRSKARFVWTDEFHLFYNKTTRLKDRLHAAASGHISPLPIWLLGHFVEEAGLRVHALRFTREALGMRGKWVSTSVIFQLTR